MCYGRGGKVPALSLPQETLNPLIPGQGTLLCPSFRHVVADGFMPLISNLHDVHRVSTCPPCLAQAAGDDEHAQDDDEQLVAHEYRLLLLLGPASFTIPSLPVFPRCIHRGITRLIAPTVVGMTES